MEPSDRSSMFLMDLKEVAISSNVKSSLDVDKILKHLEFLEYFNDNPQYLNEAVLKQSLRRCTSG